ncbi:MAG: 50S ribosomal protein L24 [Candidatus Omnitrophica bacterium]|nr:50S ribosomal protein L24 [Candidatus Omnitrophota bacterium]MDD5026993.1 50S ribosomal protein L24 [Candidatus Omnitrophota bacterium]MDD5661675.1 50S ribosomal protein L24 [Candidatus Omnitrophota bacterium]
MQKIRKNDIVQAVKGKDKGKKGKVIQVISASGRALVEGLNLAKKHKRQTRQEQKGGIVSIEMPIALANIMLVCKHCNRPSRAGFSILKDGTKIRICKICKEAI